MLGYAGDEEQKEADNSADLVALYQGSEERRVAVEELGGIMRRSREKQGNVGPIPSFATTFLWQVKIVGTNH